MLDFSILIDNFDTYLEGFKNTIFASLIGLVGSFVIGVIVAIMRIAPIKPLNWIGTAYVEFIRNIPLLIIAFFFYIGLPTVGVTLPDSSQGRLPFPFIPLPLLPKRYELEFNLFRKGKWRQPDHRVLPICRQ